MKFASTLLLAAAATALGTAALADCTGVQGRVSIVGNEFPAIQSVGALAMSCAAAGLDVRTNLTSQHETINVAGMTANPAEYTSASRTASPRRSTPRPTAWSSGSTAGSRR